jgi:hypothetical protein
MREWLAAGRFCKVVYAGDGGNDYEGSKQVPACGTILARKDWKLHRRLEDAGDAAASIRLWDNQAHLGDLLLEELEPLGAPDKCGPRMPAHDGSMRNNIHTLSRSKKNS